MTDIRRIGDSGIHTVEGNLAGSKAARLTKQREQQQLEYEATKKQIKDDNAQGIGRIDSKFSAATDSLEQEFRRKTVGLVSADDFRKAREAADAAQVSSSAAEEAGAKLKHVENKKNMQDMKRKKAASTLSFSMDDGDVDNAEESTSFVPKKKVMKNPAVDTSFLPDTERDRELEAKREQLKAEWLQQQETIKNEVRHADKQYCDVLMYCVT